MNDDEHVGYQRAVIDLMASDSTIHDLDETLRRLRALITEHSSLPVEPRAAIFLLNSRGRFIQIAQFGMEPILEARMVWESPTFSTPTIADSPYSLDIVFAHRPEDGGTRLLTRGILLPLRTREQGLGYAVFFLPPDYQIGIPEMRFINDLAHVASSIVQQTLTNETLRVYELELEEARANALQKLGIASEYRDNDTGWHVVRMSNYAVAIARALGLPDEQRELLYAAAPMHDVGKIGMPDAILLKPGKLTVDEFEVMKTHTDIGVRILEGDDPLMQAARDIAGSHHEHWDGTGYPRGVANVHIPLLARICAVADVFDALTSRRPYKEAWTADAAHRWILSEAGKRFDPAVTAAFDMAYPELQRIRQLYRDSIVDPKQVLGLPPVKRSDDCLVPWDEGLSVGIDVIDEHHRYLFDLINALHVVVTAKKSARDVSRSLKALGAYAKIHFAAEEQMMAHHGFQDLPHHRAQHRVFEGEIAAFCQELLVNPLVAQFDIYFFLLDWLTNHIRHEDTKLIELTGINA